MPLRKMILLGITAFWLIALAGPVWARVNVQVGINLPSIVFSSPPELIVLPETDVYVVPDIEADVFFYEGFWWRSWNNRWYRSRNYDRGWTYRRGTPAFHRNVPRNWRQHYQRGDWNGQAWKHECVQQQQVQKNWRGWKQNRYWERQRNWGVQGEHPRQYRQQQRQQQRQQRQPDRRRGHDDNGRGQGYDNRGNGDNGRGQNR